MASLSFHLDKVRGEEPRKEASKSLSIFPLPTLQQRLPKVSLSRLHSLALFGIPGLLMELKSMTISDLLGLNCLAKHKGREKNNTCVCSGRTDERGKNKNLCDDQSHSSMPSVPHSSSLCKERGVLERERERNIKRKKQLATSWVNHRTGKHRNSWCLIVLRLRRWPWNKGKASEEKELSSALVATEFADVPGIKCFQKCVARESASSDMRTIGPGRSRSVRWCR